MYKKKYDGEMNDKIDIKVFILFLLDELRYPMSESVIREIVSENGVVGRFDFAECFSELVEQGHIIAYEDGGDTLYVVSPLGQMVASELQGTLHDSIREKSRASAMKRLSLHLRGAKARARVEKNAEGGYLVHCEITDQKGIMMQSAVTVPTESEANTIVSHFEEHPEEVCRGVLAVLTGKVAYYMK
jgi:hypothetical protein